MKIAQTSLGTLQPPEVNQYAQPPAGPADQSVLNTLETFISNMIGVITVMAGILFIAYFIYGAMKWITGGGDAGKIQKARDQMVQGVIGLVIVIMAYSLIGIVGTVLGINLLRPAELLSGLIP